jgi:hypothetical protein
MRNWQSVGIFRGAVLGLLLAIGWDTSSQTTLLESDGGHVHLTFQWVVGLGITGAVVGGVIATVIADRQRRAGPRPPS